MALFSLSPCSLHFSVPGQFRNRHFRVFRRLGVRYPAEPEDRLWPCNVLEQLGSFLQSLLMTQLTVSPLTRHNLPSSFTHIQLRFFFLHPTEAYVCLSVQAPHEPNGESRQEWNSSLLRDWWASARAKISSLQDKQNVTEAVRESLTLKICWCHSHVLGGLFFLVFSVPRFCWILPD